MPINVTVGFAPEIKQRPPEPRCIKLCCDHVTVMLCDNGCCAETYCERHPAILIRAGKLVGTSA